MDLRYSKVRCHQRRCPLPTKPAARILISRSRSICAWMPRNHRPHKGHIRASNRVSGIIGFNAASRDALGD